MNYNKIKKYVTDDREPFFLLTKKYIHKASKILDVGPGDGLFAEIIGRKDVYMIDSNQETLASLKNEFSNCVYGKAPEIPYRDSCFDVIHISHLIEHLLPQDLHTLLKEVDRCLRIEGYLVISAPMLWEEFYDDLSHIKPYNPRVFKKYLCNGFGLSCTKPLVSRSYIVKEEIYRYHLLPYGDFEVFIRSHLLSMLLLLYKKIKYKLGFRKLEKSGFTLILQKRMTNTHIK